MLFKSSRYNFFVPEGNGQWLAYNSLRGGLARMDQSTFDNLQRLLNGDAQGINSEQLHEFKRGGFIVISGYSELDQLRIMFEQGRYHSHLDLTVVPTLACNFGCSYCYEKKDPAYMKEETIEAFIKFIDQRMAQLRPRLLQLTWYGGEPLLVPRILERLIIEFLRLCKKYDTQLTSGIITNGSLLNEANFQLLKRGNLGFVQVTIDGDEKTHNQLRPFREGKPSYQAVVQNIDRLIGRVAIGIRLNIQRRNSSPEQIRLSLLALKERGWFGKDKNTVLGFGFVRRYTPFCGGCKEDYLDPKTFSDIILAANQIAIELDIPINIYPKLASVCTALAMNSYCIGPEGEIYKCWSSIGNPAEILGNVRNPEDLYGKKEFLRWLSWSPFRKAKCRKCSYLPICLGGCAYISMGKMKPSSSNGLKCRVDEGECHFKDILRL